jgi:outer membrane protein assembly factor BamB
MPLSCKFLASIASILACIRSTMRLWGAAALALAIVLVPAVVATGSAQAQTVHVLDRFMGLPDGAQPATNNPHFNRLGDSDWPMYGHDLRRSFANPASGINAANVGRLTPAWSFSTGDAVTTQAVTSEGIVYIGSWDGYLYALDQATGAVRWKFAVDCQNAILPSPARCLTPAQQQQQQQQRSQTDGGIITSSAAVVGDTVYFGGGRTLYALNSSTGSLRWKHIICGNPDNPDCRSDQSDGLRIFSSPAVYGGLVYVGADVDGQKGYRGGFYAVDAGTGTEQWHFEVDPVLDANGNPILNQNGLPAAGQNRGCGNVWSSASIDSEDGLVIFGTADCNSLPLLPYHIAVLALESASGRLHWAFTPHAGDTRACDFDFGATANLADGSHAAIGGKDGTFYLLDLVTPNPNGAVDWSTNVVFGGSAGGFYGGAADNGSLFFSTTGFGDFSACDPGNPGDLIIPQEPSMHAFDAGTGAVAWQGQLAQSVAATVASDDVVFTSHEDFFTGNSAIHFYNATMGTETGIALSVPTSAPPTVANHMLLQPTGDIVTGTGGGVIAYTVGQPD